MTVVARARNVTHYYELRNLGVELIERETLDSALMSGRSVLELLGFEPHQARTLAMRFRRHNVEQLEVMRAALRRRGQADRHRQAGPPAARGAVRAGACRGTPSRAARRLGRQDATQSHSPALTQMQMHLH